MELPQRKQVRLKNYDYSKPGYYYITICSYNKKCCFGRIPLNFDLLTRPFVELSAIGSIISAEWYKLKDRYPDIQLDHFVVMPNHMHGIIIIKSSRTAANTVFDIIRAYKSLSAISMNRQENTPGRVVWQRGFYEHIIRDEDDLFNIRQYISNNPAEWEKDEHYVTTA